MKMELREQGDRENLFLQAAVFCALLTSNWIYGCLWDGILSIVRLWGFGVQYIVLSFSFINYFRKYFGEPPTLGLIFLVKWAVDPFDEI